MYHISIYAYIYIQYIIYTQTSFQELDEAMRVTNRRVNALDNVVIPKLENTMHYIASELDEREREDLFRLKKVVAKKKKEQAIADAYRRGQEAKDRKAGIKEDAPFPGTIIDTEPKSMMDDMDDYEDPEDNIADAF